MVNTIGFSENLVPVCLENGVTFHINVLIQTICFSLIWSRVGLLFGVVIELKMLM